jgi:hypothetical protein
VGAHWVAAVCERATRRILVGDAERLLSPSVLETLIHTTTQTVVALHRRPLPKPPPKLKARTRYSKSSRKPGRQRRKS